MDKNNELINILKAELTLLTKDILQNIHQKDLKSLYKATRQLQEKMAAIMVLKDQLDTPELSQLLKADEIIKQVDNQDVVKPKAVAKKTLKNAENPYRNINKMSFVPKESTQTAKTAFSPTQKTSAIKKINIGLNDRIAFIKHLFDGHSDIYAEFINRLNDFDSYEAALRYINQEVKPQYNHWETKDEYEFRLLQLLELKFA